MAVLGSFWFSLNLSCLWLYLKVGTFQPLPDVSSVSLLLLPVPLGSLLHCFCQSCCHYWDGGVFSGVGDPLKHRLCCGERGTVWEGKLGAQVPLLCPVLSGSQNLPVQIRRGQSLGSQVPQCRRDMAPGPIAAAATKLPVVVGASVITS